MYRRFRDRFGVAGVVLGVLALVFALAGSAVAAKSALSGPEKQLIKSESKKWSKKFAKEGPQGAKGDPGTAGKDGSNGSNGSSGKDGESVTVKAYEGPACQGEGEKGTELTNASGTAFACNGKRGAAGTTGFTETLPSGKTETGAWAFGPLVAEPESPLLVTLVPISFAIPLEEGLDSSHVHFIDGSGEEVVGVTEGEEGPEAEVAASTACTGSVAAPTATAGNLCVYAAALTHTFLVNHTEYAEVRDPSSPAVTSSLGAGPKGTATTGAALGIPFLQENAGGAGTWAVTAE